MRQFELRHMRLQILARNSNQEISQNYRPSHPDCVLCRTRKRLPRGTIRSMVRTLKVQGQRASLESSKLRVHSPRISIRQFPSTLRLPQLANTGDHGISQQRDSSPPNSLQGAAGSTRPALGDPDKES